MALEAECAVNGRLSGRRLKSAEALSLVLASFVALLVFGRLFFGMDLNDEAAYLSLALRFARGDRPYFDEIAIFQSASWISTPVVWLYLAVKGNTEGLVLFVRLVYFGLNASVFGWVLVILKSLVHWTMAVLLASLVLLIVPYNIPSLGYNTFGVMGLTAGLFLVYRFSQNEQPLFLFLAGMLHSLGALALPGMVVPCVVTQFVLLCLPEFRKKMRFWLYGAGGLLVAAAFSPLLLQISPETMAITRRWSFYSDFFTSLRTIVGSAWSTIPKRALGLVLLSSFSFWKKGYLPAAIPLLLLGYYCGDPSSEAAGSLILARNGALVGLCHYLLLQKNRGLERLFLLVWVPSVAAGVAVAVTSSNGWAKAGVGMIPAAVASLVFLAELIRQKFSGWKLLRNKDGASALPLAVLIPIFVQYAHQLKAVYDINFHANTVDLRWEAIPSGPYRGIHGPADAFHLVDKVQRAVRRWQSPGARVFFYPHFPAGYLFTEMPAATLSVWGANCVAPDVAPCHRLYVAGLERHGDRALLLVHVRRRPLLSWETPIPTFDVYVARNYQSLMADEDLEVLGNKKYLDERGSSGGRGQSPSFEDKIE